MTTKILLIGFILSVVCAWIFKRHWVKRGDWVESKERGNFGLVEDVYTDRQSILVNFMNPQTHVQYTAWFDIRAFKSQQGIELE